MVKPSWKYLNMARYTIKEYRQHLGLTQEQAGARLGVSKQAWGQWETGASLPTATTLTRIMEAFEVEVLLTLGDPVNVFIIDKFVPPSDWWPSK